MRRYVLLILSVFLISNCFAQIQSDSILVAKSFWGYKFYQHDTRVNINTLADLMVNNVNAFDMATRAKKNQIISSVIGGTGGFLLGLQLGALFAGGNPNWTLAGISAGFIVVAIPISSKSYRQSLMAVELFNEGLGNPGINICVMPSGVGLMIEF